MMAVLNFHNKENSRSFLLTLYIDSVGGLEQKARRDLKEWDAEVHGSEEDKVDFTLIVGVWFKIEYS